jgi:hypothetical protein
MRPGGIVPLLIVDMCRLASAMTSGSGDANGSKAASESGPSFQHVLVLEVPSGTASMLISVQQFRGDCGPLWRLQSRIA